MPTHRALIAAAVPALLVFGVAWLWLGLSLWASTIAGVVWGLISLVVTRVLYDDPEPDLAAWRAAAPDLADWGTARPDPTETDRSPK